jgi:hypothetical protein
MTDIGLIAILILVVLVLYGIGRGLRNRSRPLKIGVMSIVMGVAFLSLVFIGNAIGIGVYSFYQFESCAKSVASCAAEQDFDARAFRLTAWMTVPKPLRPACETISPEFCVLETSYDFAPYGYFAGLVGLLIAVFIVLLGLRQKRVKLPDNSLPELDYGKH